MNVRFEIGRYEFRLSESSFGFLSSGCTVACFCEFGSVPDESEALHMWHSTGARTTAAFLINQVGAGSRVGVA